MGAIGTFLAETAVADAQLRLKFLQAWDPIPNTGFKQAQNGENLRFILKLSATSNRFANEVGC